jgi:predicted AAA+ superfamily ATPase
MCIHQILAKNRRGPTMNLESHNFHWRDGYTYGYVTERDGLAEIRDSLEKKWITIITGTRRTGKTTVMRQLMDQLMASGVSARRILYFSFDEEQPTIRELVKEYERRLGMEMAFCEDRFYIFLDEVQKLDDWQNRVKYFFDQYDNIKFVLTGSASLFIRGGARESLAGRVIEFSLGPLSFGEYLRFTDREGMVGDSRMFGDSLHALFEHYLPRQYIEIVTEDEGRIAQYTRSIAEKVVHVDIPALFSIENPHVLMKLLRLVCAKPGMILNYASLADSVGADSPVSRMLTSSYMHHLTEAFLVTIAYNYSGSGVVSERKMKRAYPANPSLCLLGGRSPDIPRLVENTFFITLGSRFFWRNPAKNEVDIVLETPDGPLPVEVKYRRTVTFRDLRGLLAFMRAHKVKRGFVVTRDTEDELHLDEGKVLLIPAWKAALEGLGTGNPS